MHFLMRVNRGIVLCDTRERDKHFVPLIKFPKLSTHFRHSRDTMQVSWGVRSIQIVYEKGSR